MSVVATSTRLWESTSDSRPLQQYLQSVWKCRYFWMSLVRLDLRTRYRGSVLGMGWSLLQPICFTTVICVVFATVFQVEIQQFGPYLMCGLSLWNFIVHSTLQGAMCFRLGEPYIRQHPAPLAIYPLRTMLGGAFHLMLSLLAAIGLTVILQGLPDLWTLLSFLPSLGLLLLLGWSLAVLSGVLAVFFPDTRHLSEVGLQILFYATPIMYPREVLAQSGFGKILQYNPLSSLLAGVRDPIVYGHLPTGNQLLAAFLVTAAMFLASACTLARLEKRVIFYL